MMGDRGQETVLEKVIMEKFRGKRSINVEVGESHQGRERYGEKDVS